MLVIKVVWHYAQVISDLFLWIKQMPWLGKMRAQCCVQLCSGLLDSLQTFWNIVVTPVWKHSCHICPSHSTRTGTSLLNLRSSWWQVAGECSFCPSFAVYVDILMCVSELNSTRCIYCMHFTAVYGHALCRAFMEESRSQGSLANEAQYL